MSRWFPCPCCDRWFYPAELRDRHVVEEHFRPRPNEPATVLCWCGLLCTSRRLQQHWENHGGVLEHYAACLLGID